VIKSFSIKQIASKPGLCPLFLHFFFPFSHCLWCGIRVDVMLIISRLNKQLTRKRARPTTRKDETSNFEDMILQTPFRSEKFFTKEKDKLAKPQISIFFSKVKLSKMIFILSSKVVI